MSDTNDTSLKWKPRLKEGGSRRVPAGSGSSAAAARAMAGIKALDRRRSQGLAIDVGALEKVSRQIGTPQPGPRPAAQPRGAGSRRWIVAAVGAAVAVAVACPLLLSSARRHSVAGTVVAGRRPLAGAELRFHDSRSGDVSARVTTASDGRFQLADLPAGEYKVTVHAAGQAAQAVPPVYANLESTPFALHVNRDLESLRMYAVDPGRRR